MDTSNAVASGQPGTSNAVASGQPGTSNTDLIAYLRVSSKNANDHEPSAAAQEAVIRPWAKAAGRRITALYRDDAVSGVNGVEDRPELHAALAALADGEAGGLLVQHMDRLSRKLTVQEAALAKVWEAGAEMYAVQGFGGLVPRDDPDDPMRTAIRQMQGVFVQLERGMAVARLRRGKRDKRARGGYLGGWVPLGQRVEDRELVPDPAEQAAVALILAQHEQGASLREIITALETGGHRTKRGGSWHPSTVSRTLARHGKIAPDLHTPRSKPASGRAASAPEPPPMPAPVPAAPEPAAASPALSAAQPEPVTGPEPVQQPVREPVRQAVHQPATEPEPVPACPHPIEWRTEAGECGKCGEWVQ